MSSDTATRNQQHEGNISPHRDPLFRRSPKQYYAYALQWCAYPRWTVEETANLLAGCVPIRELFLRGEEHRALDAEIVELENRVRAALDNGLTRISTKKYFDRTYVAAAEVIDWARREGIEPPEELVRAWQEFHRDREFHGYRTPAMAAVEWVVERYWEGADLRDAPTRGAIINALLQAFPDLSAAECEMVEHIARHPAAMTGR